MTAALTSPTGTPASNQALTFTATATPSGSQGLTQPVTFSGLPVQGSVALSGHTATFNVSSLPAGTYTLTVSYPGDKYYQAASKQLNFTIYTPPTLSLSTSSLTFSGTPAQGTSSAQTVTGDQ